MSRDYDYDCDRDAGKDEIAEQYSNSLIDKYYEDLHDEYMEDLLQEEEERRREDRKRRLSSEYDYDSDAENDELAEQSYNNAIEKYYINLQEKLIQDYIQEQEERNRVDNLIGEEYDRSIEEEEKKVDAVEDNIVLRSSTSSLLLHSASLW